MGPAAETAQHPWRGYFLIAAATLCWGAAATVGKAVFNGSLFAGHAAISPLVLTQARTTFAVLMLMVFVVVRFGCGFFRISRRDLRLCALVGTLGLSGSNFFYYFAIQKATVAIAITLQYTAPVWVLLCMVMLGRERATLRRVAAVLLAMVGSALTIGLFQSNIRLNVLGAAAALLASFSFAFYNIVAQGLVSRNHQLKVMMYALLSAALLWNAVNPPWHLLAQPYSAVEIPGSHTRGDCQLPGAGLRHFVCGSFCPRERARLAGPGHCSGAGSHGDGPGKAENSSYEHQVMSTSRNERSTPASY